MRPKAIKIFIISLILCMVIITSISKANIYNLSVNQSENIVGKFNDGIDKIKELKTYNYTYKTDKEKTPHVGVMAQDLQEVFPNAVSKRDDGFLMIRQEDMFYAMINSIEQLDKIVQSLTKDVKSLFVRVQKIDDKIISLIKTDNITTKKIDVLDSESKNLDLESKNIEARLVKLERNN